MIRAFKTALLLIWVAAVASCGGGSERADAYGNFEAVETVVSAETSGRILTIHVEEGSRISEGAVAAVVDTASLAIQKRKLRAGLAAAGDEIKGLEAEIDGKRARLEHLEREEGRVAGMYQDSAATARELDRVRTELTAMKDAVRSMKRRLSSLIHSREVTGAELDLVEESISRSIIRNPLTGTVLEKFRRAGEMVMPGTSLYSIQDLSELNLRVYVSGAQLPSVAIGDSVDVFIDRNREQDQRLGGKIIWISDSAEFTPKIIQTRDVRVDLVYALKVRVANDGRLKIGMPGEVRFRD